MKRKTFNIVYLIGLSISTVLMILILYFWVLYLNITFLIFFWVVKFLSGFGLVLSIANAFLILMDKTKNKIGKRGVRILVTFQIVIPIILIIYSLYKIFASYLGKGGVTMSGIWEGVYLIFDNLLYIWGIGSLLFTLYIFPIFQEEFHKAVELSKFKFIKKGAKKAARVIKKKYFRLKKDFAKAQVQNQMEVNEILDLWRKKFAINLLLILAIGTIIFTPIAFICLMFWLRLYVFYRGETNNYEKVALLISMSFIAMIAIFSPFINLPIYTEIADYLWTINIFYFFGIFLATAIFIKKLLNLQGITVQALKMKKKDKEIDKLKKEKDILEQKLQDQDQI